MVLNDLETNTLWKLDVYEDSVVPKALGKIRSVDMEVASVTYRLSSDKIYAPDDLSDLHTIYFRSTDDINDLRRGRLVTETDDDCIYYFIGEFLERFLYDYRLIHTRYCAE